MGITWDRGNDYPLAIGRAAAIRDLQTNHLQPIVLQMTNVHVSMYVLGWPMTHTRATRQIGCVILVINCDGGPAPLSLIRG